MSLSAQMTEKLQAALVKAFNEVAKSGAAQVQVTDDLHCKSPNGGTYEMLLVLRPLGGETPREVKFYA